MIYCHAVQVGVQMFIVCRYHRRTVGRLVRTRPHLRWRYDVNSHVTTPVY